MGMASLKAESKFLENPKEQSEPWQSGLLKPIDYGRTFIAELHGPINKLDISYYKSPSEHQLSDVTQSLKRPMAGLNLAYNLPLYVSDLTSDWIFSISLPFDVHFLIDILEPKTAPIINTDFRYGAPKLAFYYDTQIFNFIENISFSWLPLFHECTHLGDEIILIRVDTHVPISRLNISYEYTEFQITLNDFANRIGNLHSFRLGGLYRISHRGLGWFSINMDPSYIDELNIRNSSLRLEYYFNYQYQNSSLIFSSERVLNILSIEARNKPRFGVPIFQKLNNRWKSIEVIESREWVFNLYAGLQFYPKQRKLNSLGVYFHYYYGISPFGHLRNYPKYTSLGLSFVFNY